MTAKSRRSPGEGSVFRFRTGPHPGVERFGIKFDLPSDGERHQVVRKVDASGHPWLSYDDALRALHDAVSKSGRGQWTEPSKQATSDYLANWLDTDDCEDRLPVPAAGGIGPG